MTSGTGARVSEVFLNACRQHRARTAVVSADGEEVTYGELADRVRARSDAIDSLIDSKARGVGLCGENSLEYLVSYYATVHCERVPFLVDPQFAKQELEEVRARCGVRALLADRDVASRFPLPVQTKCLQDSDLLVLSLEEAEGEQLASVGLSEATATCRFTSGTTGRPKCLEFSHRAVLGAARTWVAGTGLKESDRTLCLAAFSNGLAFNTSLLPTFLVGAQLHLGRGLPSSRKIRRTVRLSKITRLVAFPLIYRLISEDQRACAEDYESLSIGISAGAVLPPMVRNACSDRLGIRIADYYGIAEVGPCTFETEPDWTEGLGKALPGVSIRMQSQEEGDAEVRVKTESMASNYLNLPGLFEESLDEDRYYRTGDVGHLQNGRLFLTGRLGGAINVGGRKIDPVEIEQAARDVAGVDDAVAFADRDSNDTTVLHLVVAGTRGVSRADILRGCRGRLSGYKVPAHVTWVPQIPRSALGKVNIAQLQRLASTVTNP